MKKYIVLCLMVVFFYAGCSKELPPGYKFLCSVNGKKIALQFPDGSIGPSIWNFKSEAASFARIWEKEKHKPIINRSDSYYWEDCP